MVRLVKVRQDRGDRLTIRANPGRAGFSLAEGCPRHHSSYVRIDHGVRDSIGECSNCSRGVIADARQRQKLIQIVRNDTVMTLADDSCALVQPHGPPGVTQSSPSAHHLCLSGSCHLARVGPAAHPFLPKGQDPRDRGLLQHHLGDQNPPRASCGISPGKWPGFALKPPGEVANIHTLTLAKGW